MSLAAFPVMRFWGTAVAGLGTRALPLALAAFAVGCVVLAVAGSLWLLVMSFAILGAASGALDISLNLRTAEIEAATGLSLFNRTHAMFPAAMLAASAITGVARGLGSGVAAIFIAVAVCFVAGLLLDVRTALPAARPDSPVRRQRGIIGRALLVLAITAALAAALDNSSQSWAAIFVETVQGAAPAVAGLAPAAFVLGLSLGRLGAHAIEARFQPRMVLLVAALLAAPAFAVVASNPPVGLTITALLLAGIGVGPVEPAVFRAATRSVPVADRGPALATVTAIAYLGYLLSPPILGAVIDVAGWAAMWGLTAAVSLVVAALTRLR